MEQPPLAVCKESGKHMSRIGNIRQEYEKLATLRNTSKDSKDWAGRDKTSLHVVIFRRILDQIWSD